MSCYLELKTKLAVVYDGTALRPQRLLSSSVISIITVTPLIHLKPHVGVLCMCEY